MNWLEELLVNLAGWARAFARATRALVGAFVDAVRERIVAIVAAVSRTYRALEAAVARAVVDTLEFFLALRQAILILLIPVVLTWAAVRFRLWYVWTLSGVAWLVIVLGILNTPRHRRSLTDIKVLGPAAGALIEKGVRIALRLFFVSVTLLLVLHSQSTWFLGVWNRIVNNGRPQAVTMDVGSGRSQGSATDSLTAHRGGPERKPDSTRDSLLPWVTSVSAVYYYPNVASCPALARVPDRSSLRYFKTEEQARASGRARGPICW